MTGTELLDRFVAALRDEAKAQRENGGSRIEVEDGHLLHGAFDGGTYHFDLIADVFLADGVPVQLLVNHKRYDAEVLHREGDRVYLVVRWKEGGERPPREIPHAQLLAEPWFLTEELARRVEELVKADASRLRAAALLVDRIVPRAASEPPVPPYDRTHPRPHAIVPSDVQAPSNANERPNFFQRQAVEACLREPLWFVWGPPGTGKTATLGRLVFERRERNETVLVTAHANVAVEAAMLAFLRELEGSVGPVDLEHRQEPAVVRVGPAALAEVTERKVCSRDWALRRRPDLAERLRAREAELAALGNKKEKRSAKKRVRKTKRSAIVHELKAVREELRAEERAVIRAAPIVFATLAKVATEQALYGRAFEAVVVDEASMASPPQVVLVGSLAARHLSIFGDFRQLSPIVISDTPETRALLGRDVFECAGVVNNVDEGREPESLSMLRIQYRMHPRIRETVSRFAYLDLLADAPSAVEGTARLADLSPRAGSAVVLVNSAGLGAAAWYDAEQRSRWSPVSALWAFRFAYELRAAGEEVALLTPYRAQGRLLSALVRGFGFRHRIATGTVHRFQGGERPAVVLDLVDAHPLSVPGRLLSGEAGKRLMTVAASRAQGKLVVLASTSLLVGPGPASDLLDPWRAEEWVPPAENGTLRADGGAELAFFADLDEAFDSLRHDVGTAKAHAYLPPEMPATVLAMLCERADVQPAPRGQALWVNGEVLWIFAALRSGQWWAARVKDARTAQAAIYLLRGPRRAAEAEANAGAQAELPAATGLPLCRSCGAPVDLDTQGDEIVARCLRCGRWRPALPEDLTGWASTHMLTCRSCGKPMVGRNGRWGLFFGCRAYPRCRGTVNPRNVL